MALPTLDELANACCLVADAKDAGKSWAICTSPADDTCTVDADFSDFYGAPVYVCEGPRAESTRRGWDFE